MSGPHDQLWMFIEEAAQFVNTLGAVGQTVTNGWQSAKATIDGAAGDFGGDALGQAFAAGFLPACEAVRSTADLVPAALESLHTGGTQCVQLYTRAQDPARFRALL